MCSNNTKICSKCNIEQSIDSYYRRGNGFAGFCKSCYKLKAKIWASENKEKRKEINKRYIKNNPEKYKLITKRSNEKSKERHRQWRKNNVVAYSREKRKSDNVFSLKVKIRNIILKSFYRNGFKKNSTTQEILKCTWGEFRIHIERQFQKGMTWDNRGEWHIDHIVPLSSAKTEEDVIKLNHYTNLRPLWAKDNLLKSDKTEFLI
jgi:hypothetical protein